MFLLIRDTPPVGMYVLNMFCMRGWSDPLKVVQIC